MSSDRQPELLSCVCMKTCSYARYYSYQKMSNASYNDNDKILLPLLSLIITEKAN